MIVDDDPMFRRIVESVLTDAGFHVLCAGDVESAQTVFSQVDVESLCCVLVDYHLPSSNGIEMVEWLNREYPTVAAVMVTGSPEHSLLERSLRARVCAFLGKPLAPGEIRRAVASSATITAQRRAFGEMRHQVEHAGSIQKTELERMLRRGDVSLDYRFYPRYFSSGDFLAYERLPDGADVFVMSDAAGHDLHASVRSAYFQGMLCGLLRNGRRLAGAFEDCNHALLDQPAGQVFSVSACALQVDRRAGCLNAWSYGAPPPAFVDWQGWVRTIGSRSSSPLGWFEDARPTLDRVGIPRGPAWMWTDGLETLAEYLRVSPFSVAYYLLETPATTVPDIIAHAGDDVLVARIWPGASAGSAHPGYSQPLIVDAYGPDLIQNIDRLQERWTRSLQLTLPALSSSIRYDLTLCAREALLNALKHGCSEADKAEFQVIYEPSEQLLRVQVSDPGPGYYFDVEQHAARDLCDPVEDHRGLMLMHAHATRISVNRDGAEVRMEFPLHCDAPEEFQVTTL